MSQLRPAGRVRAGGGAASAAPVVIIGAGPYGLALASWFSETGVPYELFGVVGELWRERMDADAMLRSHVALSGPSNPAGADLLRRWIDERALPVTERERHCLTVREYGEFLEAFARRFGIAPDGDRVLAVGRTRGAFRVVAEHGRPIEARAVIVATGLWGCPRIPGALAGVPGVVHSESFRPAHDVAGARVLVVGGAQSAAEAALAARRAGAESVVLAHRRARLNYREIHRAATPERRALMDHLRDTFPQQPEAERHDTFATLLPPSIEPSLAAALSAEVDVWNGVSIAEASAAPSDGVRVVFADGRAERFDHVVAATGYEPGLSRLSFALAPELSASLRVHRDLPVLSSSGESTAPGLFFVGALSVLRFGPQANFVFGTDVIVPRVAAAVASLYEAPATPPDPAQPVM